MKRDVQGCLQRSVEEAALATIDTRLNEPGKRRHADGK